jgi:hypothetical protein
MYEQFGAVVDQDNKVEFKLFFPDNAKDPIVRSFIQTGATAVGDRGEEHRRLRGVQSARFNRAVRLGGGQRESTVRNVSRQLCVLELGRRRFSPI